MDHVINPDCCKRLIVVVPPEHLKTTLVSVAYPMYLFCEELHYRSIGQKHPPNRVAITSQTSGIARTMGWQFTQIATEQSEYAWLHDNWGPFRNEDSRASRWSDVRAYMRWRSGEEKDPSIQWLGWTNQIQSARLTHWIGDDIDHPEMAVSERKQFLNKFDHTIQRRLGTQGRGFYVCTRVAEEDIPKEFLSRAERGHWHMVIQKAVKDDGAPTFPEKFTAKYFDDVREEMRNDRLFNLVFMQKQSLGRSATFQEEWIEKAKNRGTLVTLQSLRYTYKHQKYGGLDPAVEGPWAATILGYDRMTDHLTPIDILADKGGAYEAMEKAVFWLAEHQLRPGHIAVERQGGMSLFINPKLRDYLKKRNIALEEVQTTGQGLMDTEYGLSALARYLQLDKFTIPWGDEETRRTFSPLVDEMASYHPDSAAPKDRLMSLWFCFRLAITYGRLLHLPSHGTVNQTMTWLKDDQHSIPVEAIVGAEGN